MKKFIATLVKSHGNTSASLTLLVCAAAMVSPAQTLTTIYSFDGSESQNPEAGLLEADGVLYGTASNGGAGAEGAAFRVTRAGALTTVYSFCTEIDCRDGAVPEAGLLQAADRNFYGTTTSAGSNSFFAEYGTVFRTTQSGDFTTLYSFCSLPNCADGAGPVAGLVEPVGGDLYGTTGVGGVNNNSCFMGCGTVFKINTAGALTTLYSFCSQPNCADGSGPQAGLVQAADGNLYGTTSAGGMNNEGTIFRITPAGALTTIYNFCSLADCVDGADPVASLFHSTSGDLYGTTKLGGTNCVPEGCGTLFKVTLDGALTTLYSFCAQANCADGRYPAASVIQATDHNVYGTTESAGANSSFDEYGTIFRITPAGALTTLYSFCSLAECKDGAAPVSALLQSTDGGIYGTTLMGGVYNTAFGGDGTIFELSVGLGPFVKTRREFGEVGGSVEILGTDLTGTTSVTFNHTPAVFTVHSPSLIVATVPDKATSGPVEVLTPLGALFSNVPFQVLR